MSSTLHGCFQTQFEQVASRKLLAHADVLFKQQKSAAVAPAATSSTIEFSSLNVDVVMLLAALICVLISAIVVNAVVRCACVVAGRAWLESAVGGSRDQPCASERQASASVERKRAVRSLPCFAYEPGALGMFLRNGTECVICLSEFAPGERVRVLPRCGHAFHVRCIDRWLAWQSSCPTCRRCLFGNDEEASRQSEPGDSERVSDEFREEYQ